MKGEEEEAIHRLHGVTGLLLHRIHLQVKERIQRLHLALTTAIILVGQEGNILPGSALERLHQNFEGEARMLPSSPTMVRMETPRGSWHLFNNLMPPSVEKAFKKPPSYATLLCTSRSQEGNGGIA